MAQDVYNRSTNLIITKSPDEKSGLFLYPSGGVFSFQLCSISESENPIKFSIFVYMECQTAMLSSIVNA